MSAPSWPELVILMVHGPDLPMRGRIRHVEPADHETYVAWSGDPADPPPAFVNPGAEVVEVWCQGDRVRLSDAAGGPALICDGTTAWHFAEPGELPRQSPHDHVHLVLGGTDLLTRTSAGRWVGDDFTRPSGPVEETTFLGRRAYAVELGPPDRKPSPMQLVIDAETGMMLQQRNDDFGTVSEWTDLVVGEDLDPALFSWDGPVVTWQEQRGAVQRERDAEDAERAQWTLDAFGTRALTFTVESEIFVHSRESDGALEATVPPIGALSRRPRSSAPWARADSFGDAGGVHRWSDARWDWFLQVWEVTLTEASVEALKVRLAQLSDG